MPTGQPNRRRCITTRILILEVRSPGPTRHTPGTGETRAPRTAARRRRPRRPRESWRDARVRCGAGWCARRRGRDTHGPRGGWRGLRRGPRSQGAMPSHRHRRPRVSVRSLRIPREASDSADVRARRRPPTPPNGLGRSSRRNRRRPGDETERRSQRARTGRRNALVRQRLTRERATGVEPATSSLGSWHSTAELRPHDAGPR
jgi:hypothetical protein